MSTGVCAQCKKPFERVTTGRPKKFCSDRCRLVHHRRMVRMKRGLRVPNELAASPRWVRHIRKRPVTAAGKPASVTNPATWGTLAAVRASSVGDGVGFVLGDGVGCVDLDGALDEAGELTAAAARFMQRCPTTWVEVSPSGRGLHVWGFLPEGPGRVRRVEGQAAEFYSRDRYITVTGRTWEGSTTKLADLSGYF